jgi:hypothetical protein
MNTSKFAKVFKSLVSSGIGIDEATKLAMGVSKDTAKAPPVQRNVVNGNSVRAQVMQFADKRKGAVWQLQGVSRALGIDPNIISPQITFLVRANKLRRTGRGEYCRV